MEPTTLNEIRIDLRGNPQLKEYFSRKPDGHSCTVEITFKKSTVTADGVMLGVMTSIAPEGYEAPVPPESGGKPKKEVEPDAEEPVMVMIEGAPKKEKEEPAAEPAGYV